MVVTNERLIAWIIVTGICIVAANPRWGNAEERLVSEVRAWILCMFYGMIGSQILFWIPWTSGWGLDWVSAAQSLFQGAWQDQVIGGIALLFILFAFVVAPYSLILRVPQLGALRNESSFGTIFFFLVVSLRESLPFFFHWVGLSNPFTSGLDDLGRDTLRLLAGPLPLPTLVLSSVILDGLRARRGQTTGIWWTSFLATLAVAQWVGSAFGAWEIGGFAFVFANLWLGVRWNRLLREDRKLTRVLYWLTFDLPTILVWVGSWNWWHTGWLSLVLVFGVLGLSALLMPAFLTPIFSIVAREELRNLLALSNQKEQAAVLETEINRLKAEEQRRRALRQLAQHQHWVGAANAARLRGDSKRAAELVEKVIPPLEQLKSLIAEQRACLGQAYLVRGKIGLAQGRWADAAADAERARQHVTPDEELIGGLAEGAVTRGDRGDKAVGYCLEYMQMRRGQPNEGWTQHVRDQVRSLCALAENATATQACTAQSFAERAVNADSGLAWAHRALGHSLVVQEKWQAALASLENALALDRQDSGVLYFLGLTYRQLNRAQDARNALQESLRLNPRQSKAAHALGQILLEPYAQTLVPAAPSLTDDTATAVRWLEHATSLDARVAAYHLDLARAYALRGDSPRARAAVERSLQIDPNAPGAHCLLAELLYLGGEWKAAIPHYRAALAAFPDRTGIVLHLGHCLVEDRQHSEAMGLLTPLTQTVPEALLDLGRARLGLHQYADAARDLQAFTAQRGDNPEGCYYLGCAQAWLGVTQNPAALNESARSFERAASLDGSLWRARTQLGHVRLRQERFDDAIAEYHAALNHPGAELEAGLGLTRACLATERLDDARQMLAQLEKRHAADRRIQSVLALVAELQGDVETAKKAYRKAGASGALGVLLFQEGKTKEAMQSLNQARAEGDNTDRVLYYCGLGKSATGDYLGAIADWELLSKRHPDDARLGLNIARAWYLLGCERYRQKEYEQAAAAWERFYKVYETDMETRQALCQLHLLAAHQRLGTPQTATALARARQLGADARQCDYLEGLNKLVAGDLANGATILRDLARQTDDPKCHYNLGLALLFSEGGHAAIEHLAHAREASDGPLSEQSGWALLASYVQSRNWAQAAELIDELV